MNKMIVKVAAVALFAGLATGCASTSDLEKVRVMAEEAKAAAAEAKTAAAGAKSAAGDASAKADQALKAANDAKTCCNETNEKIDRMFKQTMRK